MKKFLVLVALIVMVFSVAACGGGGAEQDAPEVALTPQTLKNVTISLPEDFTQKDTYEDISESLSSNVPDIGLAVVEVVAPIEMGWSAADCNDETVISRESQQATDIEVIEWNNADVISDLETFSAHYTYVINDIKTEHYLFDVFHGDGTLTRIEIHFNPANNSTLQENIDAIIDSIVVN